MNSSWSKKSIRHMPPDISTFWNNFKHEKKTLSQCLAEARTELATTYSDNIVEIFETKSLKIFQVHFTRLEFWFIRQESLQWFSDKGLTKDLKAEIIDIYVPFRERLDVAVTLKSL
ncbi:uncharacterized protein BX663DRAFT_546094 [Cokeromyces recurvatus]|uniref:uncharacterized protein n=1 Tax=Cokeromyces recurvatus TaxID=90255 RepID=UPI00221E3C05|nr:uncharacterized protein BX663DRAFT_546094 [Cokeromyces recurvatus]KAI7898905.1 hypothetical protein BX663DRAFT_546094 [Cokeromyces recurvatus]